LARNSAKAVAYKRLRDTPRRFPRDSAESNRSSGIETATFIPQYYHRHTYGDKLANPLAADGRPRDHEAAATRATVPPSVAQEGGNAAMITRRDVLTGVGAGLGVAALSALAFARRDSHLGPGYQFGEVGAPVPGSGVRCTSGTLTASEPEGPFYTPSAPKRRDIRDPG